MVGSGARKAEHIKQVPMVYWRQRASQLMMKHRPWDSEVKAVIIGLRNDPSPNGKRLLKELTDMPTNTCSYVKSLRKNREIKDWKQTAAPKKDKGLDGYESSKA